MLPGTLNQEDPNTLLRRFSNRVSCDRRRRPSHSPQCSTSKPSTTFINNRRCSKCDNVPAMGLPKACGFFFNECRRSNCASADINDLIKNLHNPLSLAHSLSVWSHTKIYENLSVHRWDPKIKFHFSMRPFDAFVCRLHNIPLILTRFPVIDRWHWRCSWLSDDFCVRGWYSVRCIAGLLSCRHTQLAFNFRILRQWLLKQM